MTSALCRCCDCTNFSVQGFCSCNWLHCCWPGHRDIICEPNLISGAVEVELPCAGAEEKVWDARRPGLPAAGWEAGGRTGTEGGSGAKQHLWLTTSQDPGTQSYTEKGNSAKAWMSLGAESFLEPLARVQWSQSLILSQRSPPKAHWVINRCILIIFVLIRLRFSHF